MLLNITPLAYGFKWGVGSGVGGGVLMGCSGGGCSSRGGDVQRAGDLVGRAGLPQK